MKFFRRKRFENEMDAELRFHIETYASDLVRSGVDREGPAGDRLDHLRRR